jgi:hypothetical protein
LKMVSRSKLSSVSILLLVQARKVRRKNGLVARKSDLNLETS